MLTHHRSKRKAASLCHESLRYILYIIWGSLTNLKIAFFLHQRYTKLHHSKVCNIQTREMNTAFSSHNVTGFKGYLPRSPSSYPVRVVWNDNEAEIIYMLTRIKLYLLPFPIPFPSFIYDANNCANASIVIRACNVIFYCHVPSNISFTRKGNCNIVGFSTHTVFLSCVSVPAAVSPCRVSY